jgi:type I restriction enzyme S subunit
MKVRLDEIIEKTFAGEWGSDDVDNNGIPVLRTTNFTNDGTVNYSDVVTRKITKENINHKFLKKGDILIEKSGGSNKQPVGRVVYFVGEENKFLFNNFTGLIRVKNYDKWSSEYIFYSLFVNYLNGSTKKFENKTTGLHNLKLDSYLKSVEITERSLKEQQAIVNVLNHLNKIIQKRKKQLKKLDELVKSRFIEMFGDPVKNEKNLPLEQLSKIGILERGKSQHRPRNAPELLGGPYPLIQTGDVSNSNIYITTYSNTYSELGLKQSKLWEPGTLCITIAANIAQTAILTFKACFPDSVVGFIPNNNTNIIFIHYWFEFFQKVLEEQAPQVAQKNINLKILSELKVILPSIELQNEFADFVEQTDKSKLEIQKSLDKLEILKKSLMQKYFG